MSFITTGPKAADADAALAFVFDAWSALPAEHTPDSGPTTGDLADMALAAAFATWRKAKAVAA